MKVEHIPVMLEEVIEYLDLKPGENVIDCTFGGGGHSRVMAEKIGSKGKILGIDADTTGWERFKKENIKLAKQIIFVNNNFSNLKSIYEQYFHYAVSGILLDLGLSTLELEDGERGFSFLSDAELDMRFDLEHQDLTVAKILN